MKEFFGFKIKMSALYSSHAAKAFELISCTKL